EALMSVSVTAEGTGTSRTEDGVRRRGSSERGRSLVVPYPHLHARVLRLDPELGPPHAARRLRQGLAAGPRLAPWVPARAGARGPARLLPDPDRHRRASHLPAR